MGVGSIENMGGGGVIWGSYILQSTSHKDNHTHYPCPIKKSEYNAAFARFHHLSNTVSNPATFLLLSMIDYRFTVD